MILGYEQPVAIPGMLVYDKDMLKMYLGALLKDYEEGLAEEKEFNEKYAEFLSPSAKDTENYYNLSLGPIQLYLNLNPNAIRSVEGRARLRLLMNSIPYDKLAQLRESAANQQARIKAEQAMLAEGKRILPDGYNPNSYDTLASGIFTQTAPTELKTLNQYTTHLFDNLQDSDLGVSPKDKRYRLYGVTEAQMRPIVDYSMQDLITGPLGQFYYNNAKLDLINSGIDNPTDNQIKTQFANNIIAANHERVHVKDLADEFATMDYQDMLIRRREREQQAAAERLARIKAEGKDKDDRTNSYRLGVWLDGMATRGITSGEQYTEAKKARAYSYVKNMKVYVKSLGKNVLFSQLSAKLQSIILNGNGPIAKAYEKASGKLDEGMQSEAFYRWRKNGGSAASSVLSLAQTDNTKQFVAQYAPSDYEYNKKGKVVGYTPSDVNKFYTTTELTGKSGQFKGLKGKYDENDSIRKQIKYFAPVTGSRNMIVLYEKSTHSYHTYRKVKAAYGEDKDNLKYATMWMETFDPQSGIYKTSDAQAHDNLALHAINQGVEPVDTAIDTDQIN